MRRRAWVLAVVPIVVIATVFGDAVADELGEGHSAAGAPAVLRPTSRAGSSSSGYVRTRIVLGRSVRDRPIVAHLVGDPAVGRPALVVGCIHGNEPAGIAVARDLVEDRLPRGVAFWVIPSLNPDGVAAGTRQNAHGVDLNRNFPWRWRPLSGIFFSGPHALSEPESRIARRFILRTRPGISIWFHQHAGVVDESGGRISIERRYAHLTGLPLRRLPRYPGSATGWENHVMRGTTAFVVELPPGRLGPAQVERFSDAILRLI